MKPAKEVALIPPATLPVLMDYLQRLASQEVEPQDREAFELECMAALQATKDKVDAVAEFIFYLMEEQATAEAVIASIEESRLAIQQAKVNRMSREAERLRDMVLTLMRNAGNDPKSGKPFPIPGNRWTFHANKVAASCEITDESLVPIEFKTVEVVWSGSSKAWGVPAAEQTTYELPRAECTVSWSVDKKALLAALKETCDRCEGSKEVMSGVEPAAVAHDAVTEPAESGPVVCPKCNGKGTRLIPGSRLVNDKLKLVVK
jgi:Zn finger protein HypA/HybF involved in hydrogenase expression